MHHSSPGSLGENPSFLIGASSELARSSSIDRSTSPHGSMPHGRGANLRINRKHGHFRSVPSRSPPKKSKKVPIKKCGRAKPISHATRIEPTNLSYKDLLRKHEFTPSGDSSSRSPMKESFNSFTATTSSFKSNPSPLELSREEFRKRPIVEEPKKNVTGYQLFARWTRAQNEHKTSSKDISIAWAHLTDSEKHEWIKQSDAAKKEYHRQKQLWMDYVQEARRLV